MGYRAEWFKGIFTALVTPFDADQQVNEEAFRKLARRVLPHVNGLVPCGTTGEFVYLSLEERKRLIEISIEEADGEKPVIAGTGCTSTRDTIELTNFARDAGASAVLVVAPWYLKPSFNEVYDHYRAVDQCNTPVVMYNIPQCAGTHFHWWTAEGGLLDFDNTIGIKDSSGEMAFIEALLEKTGKQVSIIVGNDEIVQPALAAGADGAILGSANLVPDIWQKVYQANLDGDLALARELQLKMQKLVRIIVRNGASQACKEGLAMTGLDAGNCRHPIMPGGVFRREDREEVRLQLESLGKIDKRKITFDLGNRKVESELHAIPSTPSAISGFTLKTGEGFAGPPLQEIAHVDLLIGLQDGPVGRAITRSIEAPSGKSGLEVIRQQPQVLLVPTITMRTERQKELFQLAARGVLRAIDDSITDGFLPEGICSDISMIVNAFVHSAASIGRRVELNNYKATRQAIRKAMEDRPGKDEMLAEKQAARHPFRYAP